MLSNIYRFHGHGSLRYVYKNGQAVRSHFMTVKYTHNPHRKRPRFAVVVSKKVLKSAVGRNRIRRRVYEIVRHELPHFVSVHDIVIIAFTSELATMSSEELTEAVKQLFDQAGLYK
jgi:ribonuclease P protein component